MIKLKNEINKSATMRELRKEAEKGYEHSWQPELRVEAFMKGAEALLNLLHLPRVVERSEQLKAFLQEIENDKTYILNDYYKNKAKKAT